LSTSGNGAIGKVVPCGLKEQQEINEATKVHRKNEVVDMFHVGGCDLDCLLPGMG
jgi:hypothetical protein